MNRKARRSALRAALSQHAADGTFGVLDASSFAEPSTSKAAGLLAEWGKEPPLVVVTGRDEANVSKSTRSFLAVLMMACTCRGGRRLVSRMKKLVHRPQLTAPAHH